MSQGCLLYYITDRTQLPGDESARRRALLAKISEAASAGVDYIQVREKDLSTRELEQLAAKIVRVLRSVPPRTENREPRTRLLINSRTDIALAVGADGVHLRGEDISPAEVRSIVKTVTNHQPQTTGFQIAVSCHSSEDVARAANDQAGLAVFAPVFEKRDRPESQPAGLAALREACKTNIPVLALGGVTLENAFACLDAGTAGIAGIRLFQENRVEEVVARLRARR